ncbi:MAG: hypothetical protein AB8F26_04005 [Phycisphaerales bacterium]
MRSIFLAVVLAFSAAAHAQSERSGSASGPESAVGIAELLRQVDRADPVRRAGLRADLIRRAQKTIPTLVIVSDTQSYLHAISGWEGARRYPILWDDGTVNAAEDIARFVRAFTPSKVIRLTPPESAPAWPSSRSERERILQLTAARSLQESAGDYHEALGSLRAQGLISPGIVLLDVDDPTWVAGLALAAARLQPIGFIESPGKNWQPLTSEQADELENTARSLAKETGLSWRSIGDQIDSITLCANTGTKLKFGPGKTDIYATTARIGRFGQDGAGERWANTGQIIGSFSQSTYRAMCALFLTPSTSFIFDGYKDEPPWNTYDGTEAGDMLKSRGFEVQIHDMPKNTAAIWRTLTARPVRGGLWLINTHGQQSIINLQLGAVPAVDIPMLETPAMLHIVHSYSTANPTNRGTVAGSMLEHGVYAMLGSVDEPYLQAFVPTPVVVRRLLGGLNFAAAVRFDDAPIWKLTVLGDPLITLGPPGELQETTDTGLHGELSDLDDELDAALKSRNLPRAVRTLTLLGRDHDAARLATAVMSKPDTPLTSELAAKGIPALFRDRKFEEVLIAYAALTESQRQNTTLGDCFWFSGRFLLGSARDADRVERLMRLYQRPDATLRDAEEIATRIKRRSTQEAVIFLESLRPTLTKQWEFDTLDAALKRIRGN